MILNSFKRNHWYKALMALFICLSFLIPPSCQKYELDQDSILDVDNLPSSALAKKGKPPVDQIKDADGNIYNTVKIGTQTWMAENLKTTKFRNGKSIPLVTVDATWNTLTTSAYSWFDNHEAPFKNLYGALYNWFAVNTGKLCPTKWHVPSDAEWTTLENYLIDNGYNYDGTTTGNKIAKALGSASGWMSSTNPGAVGNTDYPDKRNATGFTALPGGHRTSSPGWFAGASIYCDFWTTTQHEVPYVWIRLIDASMSDLNRSYADKRMGCSVRCLRD